MKLVDESNKIGEKKPVRYVRVGVLRDAELYERNLPRASSARSGVVDICYPTAGTSPNLSRSDETRH